MKKLSIFISALVCAIVSMAAGVDNSPVKEGNVITGHVIEKVQKTVSHMLQSLLLKRVREQ